MWYYWKVRIRRDGAQPTPTRISRNLWGVYLVETGDTISRHRTFAKALKSAIIWQLSKETEGVKVG
jgi:hypothetical protein